jgi:PAS domain S-box-containing protein
MGLLIVGVKDYAIYMLDAAGRVMSWNWGAERISGYAADDILGQPFALFFPEGSPHEEQKAFLKVAAAEGRAERECWQVRQDGGRYHAHMVATALRDTQGRIRGFSIMVRDTTSAKQAQDALKCALQAAEDAARARQDFVAMVSHDLRQPLSIVQMQAHELHLDCADRDDDGVARGVRQIAEQAGRAAKFIDYLLDISRLETETPEPYETPTNLCGIVAAVVGRLSEPALRAGSTLSARTPHAVIGRWDPFRLEQIVANLIDNAIKYGAGQPIEVSVSEAGGAATLRVSDRGVGIAPEHHARIFERGARVEAANDHKSYGLGLWIVQRVVTAYGGSVRIESAISRGTTFEVTLPRLVTIDQPRVAALH